MTRSTFDEYEDFVSRWFEPDFEKWYTRRRLRAVEDRVENDLAASERALFEEIHRTQGMLFALVDALAAKGVVDRAAVLERMKTVRAGEAKSVAAMNPSRATTTNTTKCDRCGAEVTPKTSFVRGEERLCNDCYDAG